MRQSRGPKAAQAQGLNNAVLAAILMRPSRVNLPTGESVTVPAIWDGASMRW